MELMKRRRELMQQGGKLDTTAVIAETGKYWSRTIGVTTDDALWGVTKVYDIDDPPDGQLRVTSIMGYVGTDSANKTFQYHLTSQTSNYWYFNGTNPRHVLSSTAYRLADITFSIELSKINDAYAYIVETGQILFAGKNTPYYGYTNINDMPT